MARRRPSTPRTIVTPEQLVAELSKLTSPTIVVLLTNTAPAMRKRSHAGELNPFWKKLRQLSKVRGMIGGRYENARHTAAKKLDPQAPKIKSSARKWGARRKDAPLVDYRGHVYLDFHLKTLLAVEYRKAGNLHRVNELAVRNFLRGREDAPVHWRNYMLDNVREVRMNGAAYVVKEPP